MSLDWQREDVERVFGKLPDELWFEDDAGPRGFKRRAGLQRMLVYCRCHSQPDETPGQICVQDGRTLGYEVTSDRFSVDEDAMFAFRQELLDCGWRIVSADDPDGRIARERYAPIIQRMREHVTAEIMGESEFAAQNPIESVFVLTINTTNGPDVSVFESRADALAELEDYIRTYVYQWGPEVGDIITEALGAGHIEAAADAYLAPPGPPPEWHSYDLRQCPVTARARS